MDKTPYAPPQAPVSDITPARTMIRPWQVRAAVALCWLSIPLDLLESIDDIRRPHEVLESPVYLGVMLAVYVPLLALFVGLIVMLARGHRWARIVFSILTLLALLGMIPSVPVSFSQAWYFGVLNLLTGLMGAGSLWLLFTGPANAWFRTRGGRIEAP